MTHCYKKGVAVPAMALQMSTSSFTAYLFFLIRYIACSIFLWLPLWSAAQTFPLSISHLPKGEQLIITYKVVVKKPLDPRTTRAVSDQISGTHQDQGIIFSDDPDTPAAADATMTSVLGCEITNITAGAPVCGTNNQYSINIAIENNGGAPLSGDLVIEAKGQLFVRPVIANQIIQTVSITLPADGQPVNVKAYYADLPECELIKNALFTAPVGCGVIGNRIWEDSNGDGIQNDAAGGIANVRVTLMDCDNLQIAQALSDNNGNYLFNTLPAGEYKLHFDLTTASSLYTSSVFTKKDVGSDSNDSDVDPISKATACFVLSAGQQNFSIDAGIYVPGQIGNLTWIDTDKNFIFNTGDTPLPGVPVTLFSCTDTNVPIATTTTDASGLYLFSNLPPGDYRVKFDFPPTGIYERVGPNMGNDAFDSDALSDGLTNCYSITSRKQELTVDAGYTFCPPASTLSCRSSVNINTGADCATTVTPEMLLTAIPTCLSTLRVRILTSNGIEIGNTVSSQYIGQTLLGVVEDIQSGVFCTTNLVVNDRIKPIIECPPNTNKAAINQQIQIVSSTLGDTDATANFFNQSCYKPLVSPGGGDHLYDLYTFTVSKEDVFIFEFSASYGDVVSGIYEGAVSPGAPNLCENILARSYTSFTPGFFFTNLNPIVRLSARLFPGKTYTLLTTSKDPGVFGTFFWAAYSDADGLISGIPSVPTVAQYDLICTDIDEILNNQQSPAYLGTPIVTDNCSTPAPTTTFTDVLTEGSECTGSIITRTFTAKDASNNTAQCSQVISIRKPTIADVFLPTLTHSIACDKDFDVDVNGNPHPSETGYPAVRTAFGLYPLTTPYCNIAAVYQDKPRIITCETFYSFTREWSIIDLCNPANSTTFEQLVRIEDKKPPIVECPAVDLDNDGVLDTLTFSTTAIDCNAIFDVPFPRITDNCSSSTFMAEVLSDSIVLLYNAFGQVVGSRIDTIVRATVQSTGTMRVTGIPIGIHRFRYTVTDDCGNKTVFLCPFKVEDQIEPVTICASSLTVSLGGEGFARIFNTDIDEGGRDNCALEKVEVRRRYTKDPQTCLTVMPYFSEWGTFVDVNCCDINQNILVELRATDKAGNQNTCSLEVMVRDMVRPFCTAPANVSINCTSLPTDFVAGDKTQLQGLFGTPTVTDNCSATWEELDPLINLTDCRSGTITRRFRAADQVGNTSINTCQQIVTINRVNNYEIKFPKDADVVCGAPSPDTLMINALGCDKFSVSVSDEVFSPSGNECYKIFRTYRVINFCEHDGVSQPMIVGRDEDCDNRAGDEDVWVLRRPSNTFIDRNNAETDSAPAAGAKPCAPTNPRGYWRTSTSGGYWQYTQVINVFDDTAPEVIFIPPSPFCATDAVTCKAPVATTFIINEACDPANLSINISVDLNANNTNDGTLQSFGGVFNGAYPSYQITGTFPIGKHQFDIQTQDACGNAGTKKIPFEVIDCKAPIPTCRLGTTLDLIPLPPETDADGDGLADLGAITVFATDFIIGSITDCTGPIRYSINRLGQTPNINQDSLVFTCADIGNTVFIEIYTWDSALNPTLLQPNGIVGGPNYGRCETSVLIQDNALNACVPPDNGKVNGLIKTEDNRPIEAVSVLLSGEEAASTYTIGDGSYGFGELREGHDYTVVPLLDTDHFNGVSTIDLVLITKHILRTQQLDSPYKLIAADVNNSKTISTLDLIQIRKLILGIDSKFSNNTSWRFVRADFVFPVPANPWFTEFPEVLSINNLDGSLTNADFIGIKIGDVNLNAETTIPELGQITTRHFFEYFFFEIEDIALQAGGTYTVPITADISDIQGYQLTFHFDPDKMEVLDITYGMAQEEHFAWYALQEGFLPTSWHHVSPDEPNDAQAVQLFSMTIRAKADGFLSTFLNVSSRYTKAEAYNQWDETIGLGIRFTGNKVVKGTFELYQNRPNPFAEATAVSFFLPEAMEATLSIHDARGQLLYTRAGAYAAGFHQVWLHKQELPAAGVLFYTLQTPQHSAMKKMLLLD